MNNIFNKATEAANYLSQYGAPTVGVIQGTGLSSFSSQLANSFSFEYKDIPNMPSATVPTHKAICTIGNVGNTQVVSFAGRLHYYEGHSMQDVAFPVRIMQMLGVDYLLMSNAAGGLNEEYTIGQLITVKDHINTFPENPLRGVYDQRLGVMFPDMSNAYDSNLRTTIAQAYKEHKTAYHEGVYLGLQGPSLETPAEYAHFKSMGADVIGMSTVPEVIVANQAGIKTGVISVVTNVFDPNNSEPTLLEDVVQVVEEVEPTLINIMLSTIEGLQ